VRGERGGGDELCIALTLTPRTAGYTASKGAVAAMTRTFALDVAKQGIVANSIAPGCKSTHLAEPPASARLTAPHQFPRQPCSTTRSAAPSLRLPTASRPWFRAASSATRLTMPALLFTSRVTMRSGSLASR
jgi:NAD(P)-dependent dehydrogenase (short-subunit alcohol dehydrogenase family)